jgi:hypothetical protein
MRTAHRSPPRFAIDASDHPAQPAVMHISSPRLSLSLLLLALGCAESHRNGEREGIACGDDNCPVATGSFCVHCPGSGPICATAPEALADWWTPGSECPDVDPFVAPADGVLYCDGPEDCADGRPCLALESWATCDCGPGCEGDALCHDDDDCGIDARCALDPERSFRVCR